MIHSKTQSPGATANTTGTVCQPGYPKWVLIVWTARTGFIDKSRVATLG